MIRRVKDSTPGHRYARRHYGPLSSEADQLLKDIRRGIIGPESALQEQISKGSADADVVAACLRGAMSLSILRPEAPPGNIASMILQHIWGNSQLWSRFVYAHPNAFLYLCQFAVSERLDKILVDWLFVQDKAVIPMRPLRGADRESYWRSALLANLAHAYFSRDRNLNSAIMLLFKVVRRRMSIASHDAGSIPHQAASLQICRHLIRHEGAAGTKPKLFDQFKGFYDRSAHVYEKANNRISHELDMVHLECVHPTKPQYLPAVQYLSDLQTQDFAMTNARHHLGYHTREIIKTALPLAEKANDEESVKRLKEKLKVFA